jgi:hypothetical protein
MFSKTKFPGKPSKLVNKKRVSVLSFDNYFDKGVEEASENDGEKNLASSKHQEYGYQVKFSRWRLNNNIFKIATQFPLQMAFPEHIFDFATIFSAVVHSG